MPKSRSRKETTAARKRMRSHKRANRVLNAMEVAQQKWWDNFGINVRFMP